MSSEEFNSLSEGLRYACKWYSWVKHDCVYSKNFETWDETVIFRSWLVKTMESMGKSVSIIPAPSREDIASWWFDINRNLDVQSTKSMEDESYSLKKRYCGWSLVKDAKQPLKRI